MLSIKNTSFNVYWSYLLSTFSSSIQKYINVFQRFVFPLSLLPRNSSLLHIHIVITYFANYTVINNLHCIVLFYAFFFFVFFFIKKNRYYNNIEGRVQKRTVFALMEYIRRLNAVNSVRSCRGRYFLFKVNSSPIITIVLIQYFYSKWKYLGHWSSEMVFLVRKYSEFVLTWISIQNVQFLF